MQKHSPRSSARLKTWAAAAVFAAWAGFVMYFHFAQFSTYLAAVWRKLPW